jgi:hypothetical protein
MANYELVVTAAMTRDVIAGLDVAIHLPKENVMSKLDGYAGPVYANRFVRRRTSAVRRLRRAIGARPPKL